MGDGGRRPQARPFGSSGLAALLGVGVFVLALLIAAVLIFNDDDEAPQEFGLGNGTSTATTGDDGTETVGSLLPSPTTETDASPTTAGPTPTPRIFPTLTPSPTETAPPDDEVEATEPPDSDDPEDDEPVDEDPTEPVEIPPTPAEEPVAGDFGFLPPPQLPSGGAGQSLTLSYQLATSLETVPTSGTVYLIEWPSFSEAEVETMALNLGIDATPEPAGEGLYTVSDGTTTLFVSPTVIEYSSASSGSGALPSADVAIDAAWNWFSALGLGGVEAGGADVVAVEEDAGLSVVAITPAYPTPNLAPTPAATVKVSASGVVEEARVVWPGSLIASDYGLRPAIDLWEDLRNGNAFVSADLSESGGGPATMNVTDISIAYTVSGSPWAEQFLVPLVVFGGTANVNGVDVYVEGYVPAVYHQGNPLG